jgi:DNA adenine methylase
MIAKPFLKWAGGKTQLIDQIKDHLPNFTKEEQFTYIEPFVGGGAILFWMIENYPNMERAIINDINGDLTDCYISIKEDVQGVINLLKIWEEEYHHIPNEKKQKQVYFYEKRSLFNSRESDRTTQSALLIFLNRTCFNGLYRVNRSNGFNVPIGSYFTPTICFEDSLRTVADALQKVEILNGDYSETLQYATANTLYYFDPPYKPLSETSSFNSYAKDEFNDDEQIRLRNFCNTLNEQEVSWMLSNSDLKGKDINDTFFDDAYEHYNIERVYARRNINANGSKRGKLTELLITNYENEETHEMA